MPSLVSSHFFAFAEAAATDVELVTNWDQAIAAWAKVQSIDRIVFLGCSSGLQGCSCAAICLCLTVWIDLSWRAKLSASDSQAVRDVHRTAAAKHRLPLDRHLDEAASCIEQAQIISTVALACRRAVKRRAR
jgi:hypothetical protein